MQRTRTLRNHEELLRKYNQKGGGGEKPEKKKEKVVSLLPKLCEGEGTEYKLLVLLSCCCCCCLSVDSFEIKDTVPVSAFGVPLPLIKSK